MNQKALEQFEKDTLELVQYCLDKNNPKRAIEVLQTAQHIRDLIARQINKHENITAH